MNSTVIAMFIALLIGMGLLVTIALLSLFSGAIHAVLLKPKIIFLKSRYNDSGFAFGLIPRPGARAVNYDRFRIRLYNPFGVPSQIEILREFERISTRFTKDLYLGPQMKNLLNMLPLANTTVEIVISSSVDQITYRQVFKGRDFLKKVNKADVSAIELSDQWADIAERPRFNIPERSFIAEGPSSGVEKVLKISSNPQFAGTLEKSSGAENSKTENTVNFSVSKVWIEPGCIVCNACEGIYPEVFHVTETTCIIRPNAPLNDGLKIKEAADACPVEVIKFSKAV